MDRDSNRLYEKIVFVHIHKNAGSTFWKLMMGIYGKRLVKDKSCARKVISSLIESNYTDNRTASRVHFDRHTFIGGHFYVDKYLYLKDEGWKFVTWMRDPIERTISHYDHFRRWYIEGPRGKKYNEHIVKCFEDTSFTIVKFSKIFSNYQSKFIKDIELFDFIGIVERFDSDYTKFCDMFNLKRVRYNKTLNVNPIERTIISNEQREIMKKHHKEDYEIYNKVLNEH